MMKANSDSRALLTPWAVSRVLSATATKPFMEPEAE